MADDKRISELPLATTPLSGTEEQEIIQGGVNKRVAVSNVGGSGAAATETTSGIAELATQAETNAGTDDARIVTPLKAATRYDKLPVRADVTLANGVVTIDWSAGDIQNLTITEAKVITTISNPIVGKTIILIIPGTNSLTFSTISAVIDGTYAAGVENRIYIQCLKVSGGAEYRITYDNPLNPYPFAILTSSSNVSTWTVANQEWFSKRTLTLTENSTFALSGALNGFQGVCRVTASGANRTINIPAGAGHQLAGVGDPTRKDTLIPSGEMYTFFWEYDGTTYVWGYQPTN